MAIISGACFCKAVKYELLRESQMQGLCYCTDCQARGWERSLDLLCGGTRGLSIAGREVDAVHL